MAVLNFLMDKYYISITDNNKMIELTKETLIPFLDYFIDIMCEAHIDMGLFHNDIPTLLSSEWADNNWGFFVEDAFTNIFSESIASLGLGNENEKSHLAFNLIESYCHEKVFHKHDYIDYSVLKDKMIKTIMYVLFD